MHTLVKFTNYADSFINGCLYMNTLDYFWKKGFQEQKDICEGIVYTVAPEDTTVFPDDFRCAQGTDYQFQAVGYAYCNVFCMTAVDFNPMQNEDGLPVLNAVFPEDMEKFGKQAVIIDDEAEFLRRINMAAKEYRYLCGRVHYLTPRLNGKVNVPKNCVILKSTTAIDFSSMMKTGRKFDAFEKSMIYESQNEWRLCLYRGEKTTDPFRFEIGSIKDIAHIIDTKDFRDHVPVMYQNPKIMNSVDGYYGNIGRHELRDLFYALGEHKAWMLSTVG